MRYGSLCPSCGEEMGTAHTCKQEDPWPSNVSFTTEISHEMEILGVLRELLKEVRSISKKIK